FFWSGYYGGFAQIGGFIVQAAEHKGKLVCCMPIGDGDIKPVIEELAQEAKRRGLCLRLRGITDEFRAALDAALPEKFSYTPYRDSYDYLYDIDVLTTLAGKKLQAKRNHCNRFISEHPDWHTEPVTKENIAQCRALAEVWYENHPQADALAAERRALALALEHFEALAMDGLLLHDGERVVAFSLGARVSKTYYDVNFEKAFAEVTGAYALINREFARMVAEKYPSVRWLNREDDMGVEGLRKAKESYHPTVLLEKSLADWQEA
ncbi:MAG: DUF2156 domain-containing protein, partial [Oscillospiraceae bacterium]|nr:DUF2156 domain-containing protein [Oscillospiraceae bacterium]